MTPIIPSDEGDTVDALPGSRHHAVSPTEAALGHEHTLFRRDRISLGGRWIGYEFQLDAGSITPD